MKELSRILMVEDEPAVGGFRVEMSSSGNEALEKVLGYAPEVSRFKDIGALGVIARPFDPMTLASTIHTLWEQEYVRPDPK